MMNTLYHTTMDSPVGVLTLVAHDTALVAVLWENDDPLRVRLGPTTEHARHEVLVEAKRQLRAYFAGELKVFDLPLDFKGTAFEKQVWAQLLLIPFGETRSYGELALKLGAAGAARALGAANGKNPLSIIAPCHRVIGSNGKLTGFAGGLEAKAFLLAHEGNPAQLGFTGI